MISELELVLYTSRISIGATKKLESDEIYSSRVTEKGLSMKRALQTNGIKR